MSTHMSIVHCTSVYAHVCTHLYLQVPVGLERDLLSAQEIFTYKVLPAKIVTFNPPQGTRYGGDVVFVVLANLFLNSNATKYYASNEADQAVVVFDQRELSTTVKYWDLRAANISFPTPFINKVSNSFRVPHLSAAWRPMHPPYAPYACRACRACYHVAMRLCVRAIVCTLVRACYHACVLSCLCGTVCTIVNAIMRVCYRACHHAIIRPCVQLCASE